MLSGKLVVDINKVVTDTTDGSAGTTLIVNRAGVVMTKLNNHNIIFLYIRHQFIPKPLTDKGARTAATASTVIDVHFVAKKLTKHRPPTLMLRIIVGGCCGVSGNKYRGRSQHIGFVGLGAQRANQ